MKKTISLLLVLVVCLSLCACGKSGAVKNAEKVMKQLVVDGLPSLKDTDERNQWLYKSSKTFSTVYEAINYLEDLKINNK